MASNISSISPGWPTGTYKKNVSCYFDATFNHPIISTGLDTTHQLLSKSANNYSARHWQVTLFYILWNLVQQLIISRTVSTKLSIFAVSSLVNMQRNKTKGYIKGQCVEFMKNMWWWSRGWSLDMAWIVPTAYNHHHHHRGRQNQREF